MGENDMEKLENKEVLDSLKSLLNKIEKGDTEVYAYEKQALKQTIEQFETKESPMSAYFNLENWLYTQKDKPIEIKSAMLWGGLWVVNKMGCINWNTMREMYGEFMIKQMGLR